MAIQVASFLVWEVLLGNWWRLNQPHSRQPVDVMANTTSKRAHYSPPWADVSIIGIAGSSGSGKSTLSHAIVSKLNLPWVVILSMVASPLQCIGIFKQLTCGIGLLLQDFRCGGISKSFLKWIWFRFARCYWFRCSGGPPAWSQSGVWSLILRRICSFGNLLPLF